MDRSGVWKDRMEVLVALSVVVSLIVLIVEVRTNTRAIERQSDLDYIEAFTQPFIDDVQMGDVLAKLKARDGDEPTVAALIDAYDLSDVEAAAWMRYLYRTWYGMEADYRYGGRVMVEDRIRVLSPYPDFEIYWKTSGAIHSQEFRELVDEIRAGG